jgi:hypothetical protein
MGAWGSAAGGFTSKEEVREFVRSFCETEEAEVKDVDFKDKCYATIEEAEQSANDDKWGNAVAVSYYDLPEKIKDSPAKKKLDAIFKELLPKNLGAIQQQVAAAGELRQASEPTFVKCPACESKINSRHLRGFNDLGLLEQAAKGEKPSYGCPACKASGLEPAFLKAELKKLAKLMEKRAGLLEKAAELRKKIEEENPRAKYWYATVSIPT